MGFVRIPNLDPLQFDEVLQLFLNQYRRPTKRTWERFDGETWRSTTGAVVYDHMVNMVRSVTGIQERPESHYRKLYTYFQWAGYWRDNELVEIRHRAEFRQLPPVSGPQSP